MIERFVNRRKAGRLLAERLMEYAGRPDILVMAVPRGGVPVASEVSRMLDLPMTLAPALRITLPGCPDLALGAVGPDGIVVVNEDAVDGLEIPRTLIDEELAVEQSELERLERAEETAHLDPRGKTVILVDDGLATGTTMRAAIAAVKHRGAVRIVLAVPVAAASACAELASHVTEIVCLLAPEQFGMVRNWYQDYPVVSDCDVWAMLAENQEQHCVVMPTD